MACGLGGRVSSLPRLAASEVTEPQSRAWPELGKELCIFTPPPPSATFASTHRVSDSFAAVHTEARARQRIVNAKSSSLAFLPSSTMPHFRGMAKSLAPFEGTLMKFGADLRRPIIADHDGPVGMFTCQGSTGAPPAFATTFLTWDSMPALPSLPMVLSAQRGAKSQSPHRPAPGGGGTLLPPLQQHRTPNGKVLHLSRRPRKQPPRPWDTSSPKELPPAKPVPREEGANGTSHRQRSSTKPPRNRTNRKRQVAREEGGDAEPEAAGKRSEARHRKAASSAKEPKIEVAPPPDAEVEEVAEKADSPPDTSKDAEEAVPAAPGDTSDADAAPEAGVEESPSREAPPAPEGGAREGRRASFALAPEGAAEEEPGADGSSSAPHLEVPPGERISTAETTSTANEDKEGGESSRQRLSLPENSTEKRASRLKINIYRAATLKFESETTDAEVEWKVFETLSQDGDLDRDQLGEALRLMGYREINQVWLEELSIEVSEGRSLIDFGEFREFVDLYYNKHLAVLTEEFKQCDVDNTGTIGAGEVSLLLERHGITSLPGIVRSLLKEIKGDAYSEIVGVEDYVRLREIIQYRGGFTDSEARAIEDLFHRLDENGNGNMDKMELESAIKWLGYSVHSSTSDEAGEQEGPNLSLQCSLGLNIDELLDGICVGDEGINCQDFVQVMRRRREVEISTLKQFFLDVQDDDGKASGTVNVDALVDILQQLGYITASPAVVKECARACGVTDQEAYFFDDAYQILQEFKKCEGFQQADIAKYRDIFDKHDIDNSEAISVVELGGTLRWLGFPVTDETTQDLMHEVDVDNSGELAFDEFMKIMRWYREEEVTKIRKAFAKCDTDGNGLMDAEEINGLLPTLGFEDLSREQDEIVHAAVGNGREIDVMEGVELMNKLRAQAHEDFLLKQGFSEDEQLHLRRKFDQYDPKHTGHIEQLQLQKLLAEFFPEATQSLEGQKRVGEILKKIDVDGNGKLEWYEFLQLMRMVHDREAAERYADEQKHAQQSGFHSSDVRELRKIFKMCHADSPNPDSRQDATLDELLKLFATIMPMTRDVKMRMKELLKEVDEDGNNSLSFAEFLIWMRKVDDAGILPASIMGRG